MMHDARLMSYGFCPLPNGLNGIQTAVSSFLQTDQILYWFMQMPESAQIQRVGINIVGGQAPIARFQISLRSVNDDGTPGSVLPGVGGSAQKNFVPPAVGYHIETLDHFYNAKWGEFICVELKPNLVTPPPNPPYPPPSFPNGIDVRSNVEGYSSPRLNTPYFSQLNFPATPASVWPIVSLHSATKVYGYPVLGIGSFQVLSPYQRPCLRFLLPDGFGTTFKVAGVRFRDGLPPRPAGDVTLAIWKAGVTGALQSTTFKGDWLSTSVSTQFSASNDIYFFESPTTPLATLDYGTEYFLGYENVVEAAFPALLVSDNALMEAFPGGREVYTAYYDPSGSGSWVRVNTKRLFWDLILADM